MLVRKLRIRMAEKNEYGYGAIPANIETILLKKVYFEKRFH